MFYFIILLVLICFDLPCFGSLIDVLCICTHGTFCVEIPRIGPLFTHRLEIDVRGIVDTQKQMIAMTSDNWRCSDVVISAPQIQTGLSLSVQAQREHIWKV